MRLSRASPSKPSTSCRTNQRGRGGGLVWGRSASSIERATVRELSLVDKLSTSAARSHTPKSAVSEHTPPQVGMHPSINSCGSFLPRSRRSTAPCGRLCTLGM